MGKYNKKIHNYMDRMFSSIKSKISSNSTSSKKSSENTAFKGSLDITMNPERIQSLTKTSDPVKSSEEDKDDLCRIFPLLTATTSSARNSLNKKYVGPEDLGAFCDELHLLFEDLKNIQGYVNQIGAYPKSLSDKLNEEVTELSLLLGEARHVRETIRRTQEQRRAVKDYANGVCSSVVALRKEEAKELEQKLKVADAELFKCWEGAKDSKDIGSFDTLLNEVRNQQLALDTVMKLVQNKMSQIRNSTPLSSQSDATRKQFRRQGKHKRARAIAATNRSESINSQSTSLQISQQTFQFGTPSSRQSSDVNANFPIFRFGINNVVEEPQTPSNMVFLTIEDRETLF